MLSSKSLKTEKQSYNIIQLCHQPYALENKNVFSLDLKILTEEACLMESGKAFQSLGAAIQKAQFTLHLSLDLGVDNKSWLEDRRDLIVWYSVSNSQR